MTLFIYEIEYTEQTLIVKKTIWLRNLMIQLTNDVEYFQTIMIYENNQNVITLIKNSQFHARTKYIDIQTHFIKEKVIEDFIDLTYDSWWSDKIISQRQIYSISRRFKNWIIILSTTCFAITICESVSTSSRQWSVRVK